MLFWNKICGFIAIFFICPLLSTAQSGSNIKLSAPKYTQKLLPISRFKNKVNEAIVLNRPLSVIAPNYYTQHFGIMCKKELALEKATKIPLRFRLGSLQHCNYLEGKK